MRLDQSLELPGNALETSVQARVIDRPPGGAVDLHMTPDEVIADLEIMPFVKRVWHGPGFKTDWQNTFNLGCGIHQRIEYEMVKRGHRKAATVHVTNRTWESFLERVQRDGLVYLPIVRTKSYNGFSHRHFPTTADDPNSSVYGVLACDLSAATAFKNASRGPEVDHRIIGDLLGFPRCCSDVFVEVWGNRFIDPMWQSVERTDGVRYLHHNHAVVRGSVFCSQLLRYIGARITSHLPCSFRCEKTIEVGRKWWDTMLAVDKPAALALLRILSLPVTWSVLHGVAVIETMPLTIWTNSVATKSKWTIQFTPEDALELIKESNQS